MQVLNVTNAPIYLPYNAAPDVPFGQPLPITSISSANPGVVTIPGGYTPTAGDAVYFSTSGTLPTGLTPGTIYYVVTPSGLTFSVSATKGGAPIDTSGGAGSGTHTLHLLGRPSGVSHPFKPGATVVVLNLSGGSLTLQGASDTNGAVFGDPKGPGSYSTIAIVGAGSAALAQLSHDWIRVSTAATLVLLQN